MVRHSDATASRAQATSFPMSVGFLVGAIIAAQVGAAAFAQADTGPVEATLVAGASVCVVLAPYAILRAVPRVAGRVVGGGRSE